MSSAQLHIGAKASSHRYVHAGQPKVHLKSDLHATQIEENTFRVLQVSHGGSIFYAPL